LRYQFVPRNDAGLVGPLLSERPHRLKAKKQLVWANTMAAAAKVNSPKREGGNGHQYAR
jgi:hypothetical protein